MAETSPISAFNSNENIEQKILDILSESYPNLDCGPGTPVYEFVIRPAAYIWSKQKDGLDEVLKATTLQDYLSMNKEDMNRLFSTFLIDRRSGKYVFGTVRCITAGNKDIAIYPGEIWEADGGKTYEVQDRHIIKEDDWTDIDPNGIPLHWYTERKDAIAIIRNVDTFYDENNSLESTTRKKRSSGHPLHGDIYKVASTNTKYRYDESKNPKFNPINFSDMSWRGRWIPYEGDDLPYAVVDTYANVTTSFENLTRGNTAHDSGKYLLIYDKHAYVYDASKAKNFDPANYDDQGENNWVYRWSRYTDVEYPVPYYDIPEADRIYYVDVGVLSTDVGSMYNASQYDQIKPTGASSADISSAYFLSTTNNGGTEESNYEFYQRAKDTLAYRGLCSYKSTSALLRENFDTLDQVVSIGMKDDEMLRDECMVYLNITEAMIAKEFNTKAEMLKYDTDILKNNAIVRVLADETHGGIVYYYQWVISDTRGSYWNDLGSSTTVPIKTHLGGRCDIYIKPSRYITEAGYTAPLGFPLTFGAYSMGTSPDNMLVKWNNIISDLRLVDITLRGSLQETINGLDGSLDGVATLTNLKADLKDISDFVTSSENASLQTDNLVKQMWPIVVIANIEISSNNPEEDIALAKTTITQYINSLKSTEAPKMAELIHILRTVGISDIHLPLANILSSNFIKAYYLRDDLSMEWFGLNKQCSQNSILIPVDNDSLAFTLNPTVAPGSTQISLRTCAWYTNTDLINIKVVND